MSFSDRLLSIVCLFVSLSVHFLHLQLLLQNSWAKLTQTGHKSLQVEGDSNLFISKMSKTIHLFQGSDDEDFILPMYCPIFAIISTQKRTWSFIVLILIPSIQRCVVQSLVETGRMILEKGFQTFFDVLSLYSSSKPKAHVSFSDHNSFVVRRRPCRRCRRSTCRKLFKWSSSSPEPLGQFQPNSTKSILGDGNSSFFK